MQTLAKSIILIFTVSVVLLVSCGSLNPQKQGTQPISHSTFDELLKKYVDRNGNVNYAGLLMEKSKLDSYLKTLEVTPPNEANWSKNEQLAYWINAYNAFTIQLILKHYPIKSIKDIGTKIQIPFINTPWDVKFITINGKKYDLNNIEHGILRKNYDEPRIHFAIVCASFSCPKLRAEAYTGDKLDMQLTEQAKEFLGDPARNQISKSEVKLSKIFSWFKGDFTKNGSLIDFLNRYSSVQISQKARVSHLDYDWSLNEQK